MLPLQGHDTTAAAANWAAHLIGRHPQVQEKLHEEMDSIFGKNYYFSYIQVHCM